MKIINKNIWWTWQHLFFGFSLLIRQNFIGLYEFDKWITSLLWKSLVIMNSFSDKRIRGNMKLNIWNKSDNIYLWILQVKVEDEIECFSLPSLSYQIWTLNAVYWSYLRLFHAFAIMFLSLSLIQRTCLFKSLLVLCLLSFDYFII